MAVAGKRSSEGLLQGGGPTKDGRRVAEDMRGGGGAGSNSSTGDFGFAQELKKMNETQLEMMRMMHGMQSSLSTLNGRVHGAEQRPERQ